MKELSIEEKAKAYDEAIEYAHYLINERCKEGTDGSFHRADLDKMFPALKESEDERIRKLLVEAVTQVLQDQYCSNRGVSKEKVIAWLEKQGKKTKLIEGFNTEFERQVSCLIASAMNRDYEYTKDFVKWTSDALLNYAKHELKKNIMGISEATKKKLEDSLNEALEKETPESWNKFLEKQGEQKPVDVRTTGYWHVEDIEQKPAWSEEDERMIQDIINDIAIAQEQVYCKSRCEDEINWLKSLKDRYTWKPSEEQMDALYTYIYNPQYIDNSDDYRIKLVISLYKQLKQL